MARRIPEKCPPAAGEFLAGPGVAIGQFRRWRLIGHTGDMSTWQWPPGWRRLREAVFRRDGRVCWRCGGYATTVDHVIAVVLGGTHDLANLRPCCGHCNSSAGASLGNRLRPRAAGRRRRGVSRAQPQRPGRRW